MSDRTDLTANNTVIFQLAPAALPETFREWLAELGTRVEVIQLEEELLARALRSRPLCVIFDGRGDLAVVLQACRRIKHDPYTAVCPVVVLSDGTSASVAAALEASADETVGADTDRIEMIARLRAMLNRSDRDVGVHPSTRLPGARAIQAAIAARMAEPCAVCYADLDHFKEYNDRYSYTSGDQIIRILATLLHDVVRGMCGDDGFVGHIGGDDFIFVIPLALVDQVCTELVSTFDALILLQYSEHDRRAGYFFGKDRRGQLHRVPLMTLSIGVVTNERRKFTNARLVSELATEMKTYAKTLPGSVYAVDRRIDDRTQPPAVKPKLRKASSAQ